IGPGTKVPAHYMQGRWVKMKEWGMRYVLRLPTEWEIAYWEDKPDAGACVVLVRASRGLIAIDIDDESVVKAIISVLPHTPCIKRGAKGQTLFFRVEDATGIYSTSFSRNIPHTNRKQRVVDILFDGRQT